MNQNLTPPSFFARLMLALVLASFAVPAGAQVGDDFELGLGAFREHRYSDAIKSLSKVREDEESFIDASYFLARIYLDAGFCDVDLAKKAIQLGLKNNPDDVRFLELDLWRLYQYGPSFLPLYQAHRRISRANHLLKIDPGNATAHFVLGVWAFEGFEHDYQAVSFTGSSLLRVGVVNENRFRIACHPDWMCAMVPV